MFCILFVFLTGRPAPVNLPRQSSPVPTPAPSTDGRDAQRPANKTGARKRVTFAPSTDDRDAQRSADKSGARKKETGGTAGGTKLKAKEAQKVGKMRRGGRRQAPAKSREAAKSHKMKRAGDKKATEKKARLEQEAAQIADMHAVASLLTAFPNARIGTSVSPAIYPLTPNIMFRAPTGND